MNKQYSKGRVVATVVMVVLIVIFIPILAINLTLIIKGSVNQDSPPDIFGIAPLAVISGSMEGDNPDSFDTGALIFVKVLSEEEKNDVRIGDVVCYRSGDIFVTHRVIEETRTQDGVLVSLRTKGDYYLNSPDEPISPTDIFGLCTGHVNGLGSFTMFLQTPAGILIFVGIPILVFIVYDVVHIALYNKKRKVSGQKQTKDELAGKDEEIRRLQALLKEKEGEEHSSDPSEKS